ncbi:uncharacterized protein TRIADDRAFT_52150 [Trichoplax adhaerens]|uniref:BRCT domain-containing protein n=1 Tax=Trichoplax adhaerens TaxID=10228 RepID=B3RLW9_TRIAD|nr:hypothetical protein TRIADDRAFT_52150 [Trichoplax adhaerens]EDV28859.1 hypothetical protein TRIADDRAFT_52150 [Trichoplax adhaerens]|eukprot:XP_002108061.1 hypothetical protein TRIADDRAFT_52150 [Trichoplax adhaerens]
MADVNICITGFQVASNCELDLALKKMNAVTRNCKDENEISQLLQDKSRDWFFLLDDFQGPLFDMLKLKRQRIIGPPIVLSCADSNQSLPNCIRPLYCTLLQGTILCFTGFKEKDAIAKLVNMVHFMGASIRKEMTARVTHLIANTVQGEKYRVSKYLPTTSLYYFGYDCVVMAENQMLMIDNELLAIVIHALLTNLILEFLTVDENRQQ